MIMDWLTRAGALGLRNHVWLLIAAGLALAAFIIVKVADNAVEDVISTTKDAGATEQREADLIETINRTEEGNAARDEIRNDVGSARYDQCVRSSRTAEARANCERFMPGLQAPVR